MNRIIYTPEGDKGKNLIGIFIEIYNDSKKFSHLIRSLVVLTLTQHYKKSILGVSWLIISPLLSVLVWILLQASGMFKPGESEVPYVAFVLLSNSVWIFFVSFYKGISDAVLGRGAELLQNSFPRIIIIIERVVVAFINFIIPLSLSIIVLLVFGVKMNWEAFLFIPALLPLAFMGISIGLIFAVFKLVVVDFSVLFDNVIEILKFISPVVYTTAVASPLIQSIIKWNPLTYLIDYPRMLLIGEGNVTLTMYLWCSLGTFIFFLLSIRYFYKALPWVFEKITL